MISVLIALLVIAVAFVLVSRFIGEPTIRLIAQIILGVVLLIVVLNYLGIAHVK